MDHGSIIQEKTFARLKPETHLHIRSHENIIKQIKSTSLSDA